MSEAIQPEFKYLAIKNWSRYQGLQDGRPAPWIKDWCDKDMDAGRMTLTLAQAGLLDRLQRLRGKLGKNLCIGKSSAEDIQTVLSECSAGVQTVLRQAFVGPQEMKNAVKFIAVLADKKFIFLTNTANSVASTEDSRGEEDAEKDKDAEEDSAAAPTQSSGSFEAKPETETPDSKPYVALAKKLFAEIGEPKCYANPETANAWYRALKSETGNYSVESLDEILSWSLADGFWFKRISRSRKIDPCRYFISKLDILSEQMSDDTKRPAAKTAVQRGSYPVTAGEIE